MDERTNDDPAPAPPAGAHCSQDALPWGVTLAGSTPLVAHVVGSCGASWASVPDDDTWQETALRLLQRGHRFDPRRGTWTAYVTTIARSVATDLSRKAHGRGAIRRLGYRDDLDVVGADDSGDSPDFALTELHLDVQLVLSRLSPRDRRVAELIPSHTVQQIADLLGVAYITVKRSRARIRRALINAGLGLRATRRGRRSS